MKKSNQERAHYDRSGAWLRRARLKYAALVRVRVTINKDEIHGCIARLKARGFYSPSTCDAAVEHGLLRLFWKTDPDPRYKIPRWSQKSGAYRHQWSVWMDESGWHEYRCANLFKRRRQRAG